MNTLLHFLLCQYCRSLRNLSLGWLSAQLRSIRTDKTELCTTAFEQAASQGYRQFHSRTFCNGVGGRTTRLHTHI